MPLFLLPHGFFCCICYVVAVGALVSGVFDVSGGVVCCLVEPVSAAVGNGAVDTTPEQ